MWKQNLKLIAQSCTKASYKNPKRVPRGNAEWLAFAYKTSRTKITKFSEEGYIIKKNLNTTPSLGRIPKTWPKRKQHKPIKPPGTSTNANKLKTIKTRYRSIPNIRSGGFRNANSVATDIVNKTCCRSPLTSYCVLQNPCSSLLITWPSRLQQISR